MHPPGHPPVDGMSLRRAAQLDQVHAPLARSSPSRSGPETPWTRRTGATSGPHRASASHSSAAIRPSRAASRPGAHGLDLVRRVRARGRREALPLDREHAMALEVAERAVVAEHVEPVRRRLEGPPGPVTAVRAIADVRRAGPAPLVGRACARASSSCCVRQACAAYSAAATTFVSPSGSNPAASPPRGSGARRRRGPARRPRRASRSRGLEVLAPRPAAVGLVHAGQERRDHLAQLGEHRSA